MIWLLAIGLVIAVSAYLCAPFLARGTAGEDDAEVSAYRDELKALQARIDAGEIDEANRAQKAVLQARLLMAAKSEAPKMGAVSYLLPGLVTLGLLGGTLGVYSAVGSPDFTPEAFQTPPPGPEQRSFDSLLPQLEARLAASPDDPTGWYLYGRTLMLVDRFEDGLRAYARSLELNDNPDVRREYESAQTFAEQRRNGPSAEDIEAAQSMSAADQQAMIEGMVASLRARLDDTPEDIAGWTRLLRARKVLEQDAQAAEDIAVLRNALPDQAEAIIAEAGWAQ